MKPIELRDVLAKSQEVERVQPTGPRATKVPQEQAAIDVSQRIQERKAQVMGAGKSSEGPPPVREEEKGRRQRGRDSKNRQHSGKEEKHIDTVV
ncbi:MAG: hypothetical protein QN198_07225 [Armatimonadota bacterium]|nr:hypothetical protein [Armatimonadota bacterium]MDR5703380.1 hypothetical protein [Armatimonadota bacterium]MDR7435748.1 hypothetical protein [Armatimonadota bacterium]